MKSLDNSRALVCLSGGQDSATCLLQTVRECGAANTFAVSFNYGQKNFVEINCAREIAKKLNVAAHYILDVPALKQIGDSALLTDADVSASKDGLPAAFVPGRNLIFLTQAAALAYKLNCGQLVIGVSEVDYSGYPDCRADTLAALESAINLGMETDLKIIAPLLRKTKSEIWQMSAQYDGGLELIIEHTHTCYNGDRATKHNWGYGCGDCPACQLRANGYNKFLKC